MREKTSRGIRTTIIVFIVLLFVVGVIAAWRYFGNTPDDSDTTNTTDTSTVQTDETADTNNTDENEPTAEPVPVESTPDPAIFSSIDISQLGIVVFYTNSAPGFEYQILRTSSGTSYIDFMSEDLVGTKCTDDKGVFATIIEDPSGSESQTLVATTEVGNKTYGLSLASETCTPDEELLSTYQTAFKDGFSSLRPLED